MAEQSDNELALLVTRGFAGMAEQLRARDDKVAKLAENIIRIEGDLKSVNSTLSRIDTELTKTEHESIKLRVSTLEKSMEQFEERQDSNANWIRGLLVSVLLLLLGVIFNFVMARLK